MIVSFEGINGTGKTTVATAVAEIFREENFKVEFVRLPQPGPIREALCEKNLSPLGKFFLYMADMAEFYKNADPDTLYILDRSFISTYVYQTLSGVDEQLITDCLEAMGAYLDDVILLTCLPEVAHERRSADVKKDGGNPGNFSDNDVEFYKNLAEKYAHYADGAYQVDTTIKNAEEIIQECYIIIREMIGE